ncbi:MAG: 3'-5' exonuclease [Patescibacteria group bacterium]
MNFLKTNDKEFIIFDTEFTAWDGSHARKWSGPGEYMEIVEIGAIKVNAEKLEEVAEFSILVKPIKNPVLSEYFINLTGITNQRVEREGVSLTEAIKKFSEFVGKLPAYSFGGDQIVIKKNCDLLGIQFLMSDTGFFDVIEVFESKGIAAQKFTTGTILRAFGKDSLRKVHTGTEDSRSILDGLRELKSKLT